MHRRWDAISIGGVSIGPSMVDVFDRLGFFRIFSAPWFVLVLTVLVISIVCCTLDRTPKLWRGVRYVNVEQPPAFFDLRLSERALAEHSAAEPGRRSGKVLRAAPLQGARDRGGRRRDLRLRRPQPVFQAGDAAHPPRPDPVPGRWRHHRRIRVRDGVSSWGRGRRRRCSPSARRTTCWSRTSSFEAPRRPDGSFEDFRTDLAVYQDGVQIARKTIRVNDPLSVDGYVFHQNTFGPSADLDIRDSRRAARLERADRDGSR